MDYCRFCEVAIGQRGGKQTRCRECQRAGLGARMATPEAKLEVARCAECEIAFAYVRTRTYRTYCEDCRSARQRRVQSRYNASRTDQVKRNNRLRRWYNITAEQYDALLDAQGGRCALCAASVCPTGKALAVDHDHGCCPGKKSCGRCVRGLLCHPCNTGIGSLHDDPALLRAAADYLESRRLAAVS